MQAYLHLGASLVPFIYLLHYCWIDYLFIRFVCINYSPCELGALKAQLIPLQTITDVDWENAMFIMKVPLANIKLDNI